MASTSALLSGLSGLSTNSRRLEVIGNNISNAGTTAFKSNRLMFSAAFNRTFSLGTTPSGTSGGTNPGQIGLGSALSGTQRNNSNGALNQTGVATDLAIEGEGFFILESQGERRYTRDGAFQLNSLNELVSVAGARVQGYAIDDNFQIVEGDVVGLTIPIGSLSVAEATTRVVMSGNLNVQELLQGAETPQGSQTTFGPLETAAATPALTTSLLTALIAPNTLVAGDTITLSGVERGNKGVPDATFTVTATSTVQNLFDFFQNALGIVDQGGLVGTDVNVGNNDGGIAIDPATGVVTVTGNVGTFSDLDFSSATVTTTGGGAFSPTFTSTREATGASVRTTVTVYDSVGTAIPVDITVAAYGEDGNGHYARVFFHADRDTDLGLDLEQGIRGAVGAYGPQLRFDN
ncbi:MAG: flagellar hook-basal body complex protein, partial [Planctomycetota bacterium]